MVSMPAALRQIKDDPFCVLDPDHIAELCRAAGHRWRAGPLDPARTVALFVQQIIAGNIACSALRHGSPEPFTGSAFCQARQRLPLTVLQQLADEHYHALADAAASEPTYRWHGHRLWVLDGSTFSMPDTPELRAHFGQPKGQREGCGFPVAHVLALFDLNRGFLAQAQASPLYTSDLAHVPEAHAVLAPGDLLLGDKTFSGYAHVALALQGKKHVLLPNHQNRIVTFRPHRAYARPEQNEGAKGKPRSRWIRSLGDHDQLVEWFKPATRPWWMSAEAYAQLPASIVIRELRRTVRRKGFRPLTVTVITTLLDPEQYPADELIQVRLRRWSVETDLGHLKTTLGLDVLKCQSVDGVRKELAVFVLVYNLVRALMVEAAERQQVAPERISFADTLAWLRGADAEDPLPELIVNPERPDRVEPRARKRRPKKYSLLTRPRDELRKALRRKRKAA